MDAGHTLTTSPPASPFYAQYHPISRFTPSPNNTEPPLKNIPAQAAVKSCLLLKYSEAARGTTGVAPGEGTTRIDGATVTFVPYSAEHVGLVRCSKKSLLT